MDWLLRRERLQWELEALAEAGYVYEAPPITEGVFTITVTATVGGQNHHLEVDFPELYPYFRFEVRAPDLSLPHHQNPVTKNLCLIARPTDQWRVSDTLVAFLKERLPKTITAGTATDGSGVDEVDQAEPITTYYPTTSEAIILIDGS